MTTDFLPNGPYAWTLTALLAIAIFMSVASPERRTLFAISVLMALNWLFAQLSSDTGNIGVAAIGNISAAVFLVMWRTEVALAIAVLYFPRLLVLALGQFTIIPLWLMWEVSNLFLLLQITILAGGSIDGTRRILARGFDIVGRWLFMVPGVSRFKAQLIDPFGPILKIDRSPFRQGGMKNVR